MRPCAAASSRARRLIFGFDPICVLIVDPFVLLPERLSLSFTPFFCFDAEGCEARDEDDEDDEDEEDDEE